MKGKVYKDFDEIKDEVKQNAPPILYKYRDWDNSYHRDILLSNLIWFPPPKELNDPYDIRVPVRFDLDEVNHPKFFERLKLYAQTRFPHLSPDSREFRVVCENKLDEIKLNPAKYFEERYFEVRESELYDEVGLFSLSSNPLDEIMWAHYSNNSRGFCVGFDTLGLVKELGMKFGKVEYNDTPPLHSFISSFEENENDETILKHTKWSNEAEWRFLSFGLLNDRNRLKKVPKESVLEVIVGAEISSKTLEEIKEVLKSRYNSAVKLFQAKPGMNYGFTKQELNY